MPSSRESKWSRYKTPITNLCRRNAREHGGKSILIADERGGRVQLASQWDDGKWRVAGGVGVRIKDKKPSGTVEIMFMRSWK